MASGVVTTHQDVSVRSAIMRSVKRKNTKPELIVRQLLHSLGLRFRLHRRDLPGSPDIVLPRFRSVIFVHGCFWHRHVNCRYASIPKTRQEYWLPKFSANVERDARKESQLRELGWKVVVVWGCETKEKERLKRFFEQELELFLRP